jgi:hypothetical protein
LIAGAIAEKRPAQRRRVSKAVRPTPRAGRSPPSKKPVRPTPSARRKAPAVSRPSRRHTINAKRKSPRRQPR